MEKANTNTIISKKRKFTGVVTSNKMKDTTVVKVENFRKIPKYGKYVSKSKKYKVHDVGNTAKMGDTVVIEECKPISKDKHFKLVEIKRSAKVIEE